MINNVIGLRESYFRDVFLDLAENRNYDTFIRKLTGAFNRLSPYINQVDPPIIDENDIKGIIIGNPLNMDGSSGSSAQSVKDTSQNIEKNINIPICLWDERLSTVGAFNLSSQLDINVSKREKKIDENAAAFILQGAIDFLNN